MKFVGMRQYFEDEMSDSWEMHTNPHKCQRGKVFIKSDTRINLQKQVSPEITVPILPQNCQLGLVHTLTLNPSAGLVIHPSTEKYSKQ
jgi:hypothetical protein